MRVCNTCVHASIYFLRRRHRRARRRRARRAAARALARTSCAPRGVGAYAIFEELDLTLTQVKALTALSADELTVKDLAERLGLSLPGASRAVDALVERGLLGRREDPDRPPHEAPALHRRRPRRARAPRRGAPRRRRAVHRDAARRPAQAPVRARCARSSTTSRSPSGARMTRRLALNDDNRRWWTLAAMCFALFMIMLDNTVVNVALPSIQHDLHASFAGAGVDRQRLHAGASACCSSPAGGSATSSAAAGSSSSASCVFAASSAVHRLLAVLRLAHRRARGPGHRRRAHDARDAVDHHERLPAARARPGDRHVGRRLGAGAGDRAGARRLLVEHVSWQSIFFINLPVAAGAIAITLFATHESRDETVLPTVDFAGIAAITVGLTALTLALVEAGDVGLGLGAGPRPVRARGGRRWPRSPPSSGASRVPMVDFSFFGSRTFLGANIVAFIVSFAMLGMFFFLSALHAEHPALLAAGGRHPLPADDAHGHRHRADRRPPDRPHRAAAAHDGGPRARRHLAVLAVVPHPHLGLRLPAARLRADGHRDRARHVADEHGRDERRRPQQGRRRLAGSCR